MPYSDAELNPPLPPPSPPPRPTQDEVLKFLASHHNDEKPWHSAFDILVRMDEPPPLVAFFERILDYATRDMQVPRKQPNEAELRERLQRIENHLNALAKENLVESGKTPIGGTAVFRTTKHGHWRARLR